MNVGLNPGSPNAREDSIEIPVSMAKPSEDRHAIAKIAVGAQSNSLNSTSAPDARMTLRA